ncbi:putative Peptidyl-prolyl cis-trans isomerase E [Paratrimastix pyriformis]|uniref:Peptidyl-prolyl cis-trans isomerase E n=1 Tax=Paratrimastix pyriformis TaxID=342808 RepID=A0ABQ8UI11_9EUKA|nr:putative Peptidyl-prolyl cis-trans isomerase E [Paratrimastix pyriformis]
MAAAPEEKRTLYVGGLDDAVTKEIVASAFAPFGDIVDIEMPMSTANKHRGFAFIEFEDPEDAAEAIFNMNDSVLYNRVLKVNFSRPIGAPKDGATRRPVWEEDDYLAKQQAAEAAKQKAALEEKQHEEEEKQKLHEQILGEAAKAAPEGEDEAEEKGAAQQITPE